MQGAYRFGASLSVNGQWTVQLENDGNFEGEAANNPAIPSLIGDYPEIYVAERSFPMGRLDDFQRHKVRVWANYSLDMHEFGRLDVAPLYRYNSARTFSLVAPAVALTPEQAAFNPGYVRLPSSQPVFFGARGSQEFEDYALFDLARDLRRAGVAVGPSLGEARGAEPVQQPAADCVGHDGGGRPDRSEGCQRAAVELHHRAELREGDVERQLRASAPGHGRGKDLHPRRRHSLLGIG